MPASERVKVAVLVSDIHLSLRPPIYRSKEKDWLGTQAGYLKQLRDLARKCGDGITPVPVICGGDVFDRWNSPPELINFALQHLPKMYAVPGQHDLPHHNYDDIKKSAFWTLVVAGTIIPLELHEGEPRTVEGPYPLALWGYPWGFTIQKPRPHDMYLDICVSHSFIWTEKTGYPGAPPDQRLKAYKKKLRGYDVALFGDNHKPVSFNLDKSADSVTVFNPGGFMRRNSDQRDHRPRVGILHNDGSVDPHYLDTSNDIVEEGITEVTTPSVEAMIDALRELSAGSVDFDQEVRKAVGNYQMKSYVRKLILEYLEGER